jgi:hypothetical protein
VSDAPATTTADIATRDGVGFRRRKRKLDRKRLAKVLARKLRSAMEADEACQDPGKKRRSKGKGRGLARGRGKGPMGAPGDKAEATFHGGKSMLRAWFGLGLLKRREGKRRGASSVHRGYKGRRYVVTKRGGGKYTISRRK